MAASEPDLEAVSVILEYAARSFAPNAFRLKEVKRLIVIAQLLSKVASKSALSLTLRDNYPVVQSAKEERITAGSIT